MVGSAGCDSEKISQYSSIKASLDALKWDHAQLIEAEKMLITSMETQLAKAGLKWNDIVYSQDNPDVNLCGKIKKAEDMPEAWHNLLWDNPEIIDTVTMLAQIRSIVAGRPIYEENAISIARDVLLQSLQKGQAILERAEKWKHRLDEEGKKINNQLQKMIKKGQEIG